MGQLFLTSVIMSLIIIAFLLHRQFRGESFSSKLYYLVWIIIAVRLILPFDISVSKPVYNFNNPVQAVTGMANNSYESVGNVSQGLGTEAPVESDIGSTQKDKPINILVLIQENIFNIWMTGTSVYLLYHLLLYALFRRKLDNNLVPVSICLEEKLNGVKAEMGIRKRLAIKESHLIDSPMIIGLTKPILLLPQNINIQNIDYIFRHELIHLKRKDIAYKGVVFIATAIHWFNPIVHIMLKKVGEDIELSCDEAVVRGMARDERILYCDTLINTISRKTAPICTTRFSGGKEMIKKRMDIMLDLVNKKSSKALVLLSVLMVATTSFLIGYNSSESPENSVDIFYQYKTPYIGDNSKSSKNKFKELADFYDSYISEPPYVAGYIFIKNDTLYLDKVEIVKTEDEDRIKELNLTPESDLPNGYHIHNPVAGSLSFEITDDTTYTFTDFDLIFVTQPDSDRIYKTTKKAEFIEASSYQNIPLEEQRIPYLLQVYDGKVVSITEELIYTQ